MSGKKSENASTNQDQKGIVSIAEAARLMRGRVLGAKGIESVAVPPLSVSPAELQERARAGYDLLLVNPLTMEKQNALFAERNSTKGRLLYNIPNEPFVKEETPPRQWGFFKAIGKNTTNSNYLEQVGILAAIASKESNLSEGLKDAIGYFRQEEPRLDEILQARMYEKFLAELANTGIEPHLVPSGAEQLAHSAALLAEKDERPFRNFYARNRSRSRGFPGRVAGLGVLDEYGAYVLGWDPDGRSQFLGVSSLRRIES